MFSKLYAESRRGIQYINIYKKELSKETFSYERMLVLIKKKLPVCNHTKIKNKVAFEKTANSSDIRNTSHLCIENYFTRNSTENCKISRTGVFDIIVNAFGSKTVRHLSPISNKRIINETLHEYCSKVKDSCASTTPSFDNKNIKSTIEGSRSIHLKDRALAQGKQTQGDQIRTNIVWLMKNLQSISQEQIKSDMRKDENNTVVITDFLNPQWSQMRDKFRPMVAKSKSKNGNNKSVTCTIGVRENKLYNNNENRSYDNIFSDASEKGMGAYLIHFNKSDRVKWFCGPWPQDVRDAFISFRRDTTFLEMFAMVTALYTWHKCFTSHSVLLTTDNKSAKRFVNGEVVKHHRDAVAKYAKMLILVRQVCEDRNLMVNAAHISRNKNIAADALSRNNTILFKELIPNSEDEPTKLQQLLCIRPLIDPVQNLFPEKR